MHIYVLNKDEVLAHIQHIAQLRIHIFREYPYLYDGSFEYETKYLKKLVHADDSLVAVLKDEAGAIVGAMTGLPLRQEEESVKAPWLQHGFAMDKVYYFSEILLYPQMRHQGWGTKLFVATERAAQQFGRYTQFSLATVVRSHDHPQRPSDYFDTSVFWQKRGYRACRDLICTIAWQEIDEVGESDKPLMFWLKDL